MFWDWTYILILPTLIFAMYSQFRVNSTFRKYSGTANARGLTGAEVSRMLLANAGIRDVKIEAVRGNLTDHYDPRSKTLRLSESVYSSRSLAAIGVAAHETGHALQHEHGYVPLGLRSAIVPVASIGSNLAWPIIVIGLLITQFSGEFGMLLLNAGILLFAIVVMFQLITLPVEFNASARAIDMLRTDNILTHDEIVPARKVLNAAALTYVASAAAAVMQLIRILIISRDRRR